MLTGALVGSVSSSCTLLGGVAALAPNELLGLLGKAPTISTIASAVHPLKKWKHIGLILDYTHFGSNGMLVGSSIAKLVAVVLAADSSHTSVFLPRQLNESEQERLKTMISRALDDLDTKTKQPLPLVKYYASVYNTLNAEENKPLWIARMAQMAKERKNQLSGPIAVSSTSWGLSGAHLVKLTDFENAFTDILKTRFTESMEPLPTSNSGNPLLPLPSPKKVTFISPLDGKPAIAKATQLIIEAIQSKAIEEEDVDQSIVHALLSSPEGELWSSPDLIINFTDVPSTSGYPAWHLRYAEIVNAGPLSFESSSIWNQFHRALCSFSKTVQRFGK